MRDFGTYGGRYVPETLVPALDELERAWSEAREDEAFLAELHALSTTYVGRPSPLTLVERFAPGQRHEVEPAVGLPAGERDPLVGRCTGTRARRCPHPRPPQPQPVPASPART